MRAALQSVGSFRLESSLGTSVPEAGKNTVPQLLQHESAPLAGTTSNVARLLLPL